MRIALRLQPGDDLRAGLEALTRERGWPAAFVVAGIGSLRVSALRLANAQARVLGGHVCMGCEVRTTAELLIEVLEGQCFSRDADARTGYAELTVGERPTPAP